MGPKNMITLYHSWSNQFYRFVCLKTADRFWIIILRTFMASKHPYHTNWMNEFIFQNSYSFSNFLLELIVNCESRIWNVGNKSNFNWTKQILLFDCVNFERNDFIGQYIWAINAFLLHAIKKRTVSMNNYNKNWI